MTPIWICSLSLLLLAASWGRAAEPQPLALRAEDRVLVLAPHPDDEVLACGGLLQQARAAGAAVRVVFLTYGDNNEWSFLVYRRHPVLAPSAVRGMGDLRHDEAVAAAAVLGVAATNLVFLGYPDFSTFDLWTRHWGPDRPPLHSMLTRARAVPYADARRPGAAYRGDEVLRDLKEILQEFRPTQIFVPHSADQNPDHRALHLFAQVALWDLAGELRPAWHQYLVHHGKWPQPRGDQPGLALAPPAEWADDGEWQILPLLPSQRDLKRGALQKHRTQMEYSGRYLLSFVRANELFVDLPEIAVGRDAESGVPPATGVLGDEWTDEERALFVGVENRTARRDGDELLLTLSFSRPLAAAVRVSLYAFGYRADRAFSAMPKLHIMVGAASVVVWDQDRKLPDATVTIDHHARGVTVRIPLAALDEPSAVLTGARSYLGEVPLDIASWRTLRLARAAQPGQGVPP